MLFNKTMVKQKCKNTACYCLDFPRHFCNHLFGVNHDTKHRMTVGAGCILAGTILSKAMDHNLVGSLICEGVGLFMHGIGIVPVIDHLSKVAQPKDENKK